MNGVKWMLALLSYIGQRVCSSLIKHINYLRQCALGCETSSPMPILSKVRTLAVHRGNTIYLANFEISSHSPRRPCSHGSIRPR
jgi:hypothetical protein